MGRNRTKALGKLYKKITNTELPTDANTTTEALQKVYEALTNDNKHHINVTDIIEDLAANWSGDGGGGSSDFSTATVTLTNTDSETDYIDNLLITLIIDELLSPTTSPSTGVATTPLYKGECIATYMGDTSDISVSGNATYDDGIITITGDCTITISDGAAPTPN